MTWHLDDRLLCCSADVMGSFDFFQETAPRKTAENTAKHRDGSLVRYYYRGGGEISVVITTLDDCQTCSCCNLKSDFRT